MTTTIRDIFREVQPEGRSFSEARRYVALNAVLFEGQQVTSMTQEVEVVVGSLFQVGKHTWRREGNCWIKLRKDGDFVAEPVREINADEGSIAIGSVFLVFPKSPTECEYVRIVDRHSLAEIAYWDQQEWAEAPAEVMGAVIGAMCKGIRTESDHALTSLQR